MAKQNIDWSNLGFGYIPTGERYVSNYKDGKWDDGVMVGRRRDDDRFHYHHERVRRRFAVCADRF